MLLGGKNDLRGCSPNCYNNYLFIVSFAIGGESRNVWNTRNFHFIVF